MPLPLTVSCFSKVQIGFTFLVPAHPGSPGKRAVKRVCVYPQDGGESRLTLKLRHSHLMYRIEYRIVDGWAAAAAAAAACSVSPTADACKLVVFVMRAPRRRRGITSCHQRRRLQRQDPRIMTERLENEGHFALTRYTYPAKTDAANKCIRYDTRCYFNVRSKADISQLNLPHGTDT